MHLFAWQKHCSRQQGAENRSISGYDFYAAADRFRRFYATIRRLAFIMHLQILRTDLRGKLILRQLALVFVFLVALGAICFGQAEKTADGKKEKPKEPSSTKANAKPGGEATAEQIVESTILIYAFPGGRQTLDQIRKTTNERGRTKITYPDGRTELVNYQRFIIRGPNLEKEKIRLDQEFPSVRYSLVHEDGKVFGVFNDQIFSPREDAAASFIDQIYRSIDALLRYKEDGSEISLAGKDKLLGVDFYLIDLTDKSGRKTRYYVSAKRFRVMMLEYESGGTQYRRKFYDYNYAQGTLVPFRSVLYANDRITEETDIGTITFGQKVDESLFPKQP